jgi:hypothetical protein
LAVIASQRAASSSRCPSRQSKKRLAARSKKIALTRRQMRHDKPE